MEELEVYVLCGDRTLTTAKLFLDTFSPQRVCGSLNFPFPAYSDAPLHEFGEPETLIKFLETHDTESYSLYWQNGSNGVPRQTMLFFNTDGSMIAGVVVPHTRACEMFSEVGVVVGGRFGLLSSSSPPPDSRDEFIRYCQESNCDRMIDGELTKQSHV